MQAGMVVFDPRWRVVSLNPAAERILGMTGRALLAARAWQQLAASGDDSPQLPRRIATQLAAVQCELARRDLWRRAPMRGRYEPALSPRSRTSAACSIGYLLMLRDVTEQKRAQAQILEQQRSLAVLDERERLARELHDELGQVLGYVKMQAQAARDQLAREQIATADEYLGAAGRRRAGCPRRRPGVHPRDEDDGRLARRIFPGPRSLSRSSSRRITGSARS